MKTQFKFRLIILAFATISAFSIACTPTGPSLPLPCSTVNTLFQQIYTNVVAIPGDTNTVTMDTEVHGYDFTVSANKTICKIGYQSQPAVASQLYKIEIIDNTTSTTLFSQNTTFSATTTSYISVPNIAVVPGHSYTIQRTLTNWLGNIGNTVGRLVREVNGGSIPFPHTVGVMTITGARFHQTSNPSVVSTFGIPYIDIAFQ